jgi:hypothetical protein
MNFPMNFPMARSPLPIPILRLLVRMLATGVSRDSGRMASAADVPGVWAHPSFWLLLLLCLLLLLVLLLLLLLLGAGRQTHVHHRPLCRSSVTGPCCACTPQVPVMPLSSMPLLDRSP